MYHLGIKTTHKKLKQNLENW